MLPGWITTVTITLNGDPFDLSGPLTVSELLTALEIDARRVAVEHNLVVPKRAAFDGAIVREGDEVEIVNSWARGSYGSDVRLETPSGL